MVLCEALGLRHHLLGIERKDLSGDMLKEDFWVSENNFPGSIYQASTWPMPSFMEMKAQITRRLMSQYSIAGIQMQVAF